MKGLCLRVGGTGPGLVAAMATLTAILGKRGLTAALVRGARDGEGPRLEVGTSSRIRASAYFHFEDATVDPRTRDALADIARTEHAYWGRDDFEPYRALGQLLPRALPGASPDPNRPWVLVEGATRAEARALAAQAGLANAQLHVLVTRAGRDFDFDRSAVRWLERSTVAGSLMGHAALVVAAEGPLAWDAMRLGRPLRMPPRVREAMESRLAATLPPVLVEDTAFVRALLEAGPQGAFAVLADADSRARVIERRLALGPTKDPIATVERRLRKLREDPQRFLGESRFASLRRAGQWLARSREPRRRR